MPEPTNAADGPLGAACCAFAPPNDFGVPDHTVTLPSGATFANPMRVIPNGDGSEVVFTLFQHDGMSDQQFQDDAALVLSDLHALRTILEHSGA